MTPATLLLGANLGNAKANFAIARAIIGRSAGRIVRLSGIGSSKSWGFEGPDFMNQAIVIETELQPTELLDLLQEIERRFNRSPKRDGEGNYASREMDIDILYFGRCRIVSPRLTIPHPRIEQRDFVLRLLREIE